MSSIAALRKEYSLQSLEETDVASNPIQQFQVWWMQALASNVNEANSMTLATSNKQGIPSARTVLLKGFDKNGFVFFTNYMSNKANDLESNPHACLVFFWRELERQVIIKGNVSKVSSTDSDTYFASRPLESRIGAWASPQSSVIPGRHILEARIVELRKQYADKEILRPPFWGGYLVNPTSIEFWQGRPGRLHDRLKYELEKTNWKISRLAP